MKNIMGNLKMVKKGTIIKALVITGALSLVAIAAKKVSDGDIELPFGNDGEGFTESFTDVE